MARAGLFISNRAINKVVRARDGEILRMSCKYCSEHCAYVSARARIRISIFSEESVCSGAASGWFIFI